MSRLLKRVVMAAIATAPLILTGCKSEIYSNISEREANEMLAILTFNGISVEKENLGDKGVTLLVENSELARSIDILSDNGFPRASKDSIGKIFEKGGIMSSPFEERVRYVYALGEEVSQTLREIDGVLSARVHVVMPEPRGINVVAQPSSAAVFIKHRRGVDLEFLTPQIRRLVSNSIEGVQYENVTVVLVEAEAPQASDIQARTPIAEVFPGLRVQSSDTFYFRQILVFACAAFTLLVVSNIVTLFGLIKARGSRMQAGSGDEPVINPAE